MSGAMVEPNKAGNSACDLGAAALARKCGDNGSGDEDEGGGKARDFRWRVSNLDVLLSGFRVGARDGVDPQSGLNGE
jgi:hypothetical protein